MDIRIIGCALLIIFTTAPSVSGEIKQWEGQDGRIHFGDIAPPGTATTPLHLEIITTTPSHKSLKEILRPGERRMLKRYEQRGIRLIKAKRRALKQEKKNKRKLALAKDKCQFHSQKEEDLKRKLRHGYKPSQKNSIETKIAKEQRLINRYCN